jgi:outer membrane protein TolC
MTAFMARAQEVSVVGTVPEELIPSLRPLLESGLKQAPELISSETLIELAEAARLSSGYAPMLPSISAGGSYGDTVTGIPGNSAGSSREKGTTGTVSVSQPVFRWGALVNQLQVQRISVLIAQKDYAQAYLAFVASIRRQYEALIIQKMSLVNSRLSLKMKQKTLDLATEGAKNGTVAPNGLAAVQLDFDGSELALEQQEQGYDFARRALARQVGVAAVPDDSIPSEIPTPKYSASLAAGLVADLMSHNAGNTFAVQEGKLKVDQAELNYKIQRVRLLPTLSLGASFGEGIQDTVSSGGVTQTKVITQAYALSAGWTIFDGLATRGAKRSALLQRRQAERALATTTETAMLSAQNAQKSVNFAWRQLQLSERQFAVATVAYNAANEDLRLGYISQDAANGNTVSYRSSEIGAERILVELVRFSFGGGCRSGHETNPRQLCPRKTVVRTFSSSSSSFLPSSRQARFTRFARSVTWRSWKR